jgi:hypothetical protein
MSTRAPRRAPPFARKPAAKDAGRGTRRWLPLAGVAVGATLVAYALFFGKTEEERIRQRLHQLEDAVAVDGAENPMLRAARLRKDFADLIAQNVTVAIPELGASEGGRAHLVEVAAGAAGQWRTARVDLGGLAIRIDETKDHAVCVGDAKLTATSGAGEPERDVRTVSLRLDKLEGQWRVVDISVSASKDGR